MQVKFLQIKKQEFGKKSKGYEQAEHKLKVQKVDKHLSRSRYSLIFRNMIIKTIRRY